MSSEWKRATWTYSPVTLSHTPQRIVNAIVSFLTQTGWEVASWSGTTTDQYLLRTDRASRDTWRYLGDGPVQHCGIRVYYNSGSSRVELMCFLQNSGATASQRTTNAAHVVYITYNASLDNNFLMIGGEDGFYFEVGSDTSQTNIAHGAIVTFQPDTLMSYTRDTERQWTTQGLCLDLFGMVKFANDRTYRFVENEGARRNLTGGLMPYAVRGTSALMTNTQGDDPKVGIGSRDNAMMGIQSSGIAATTIYTYAQLYTFGLLNGTLDDRYRLSQMVVNQTPTETFQTTRGDATESTIFSGSTVSLNFYDLRALRKVPHFVVAASTLLPFNNVVDTPTSVTYRIAQVLDNNRKPNIGIEWPSVGNVITIAATP